MIEPIRCVGVVSVTWRNTDFWADRPKIFFEDHVPDRILMREKTARSSFLDIMRISSMHASRNNQGNPEQLKLNFDRL